MGRDRTYYVQGTANLQSAVLPLEHPIRRLTKVAEGEGFEPPIPVKVYQISSLAVSTAHTTLCKWRLDLANNFFILFAQVQPIYYKLARLAGVEPA